MKILLDNKECLEYFHSALCNGLQYIGGYGLLLTFDKKSYSLSRAKLAGECYYEDVLIQMLKDGYALRIKDVEGNGSYDASIVIKDVYDRLPLTPLNHLCDMINENDDAITADVILQTVFFQQIIFG